MAGSFDGYTETGSTANMTVASRTIQDIEERGEVKLTHRNQFGRDALLTNVYVGALGLQRVGDTTINAVVLGAGLPFVTPGKDTVAGGIAGGGFEWRTAEGIAFFGAAEYVAMSDQSHTITAKAGIRGAW